jgi:hypothetical protein
LEPGGDGLGLVRGALDHDLVMNGQNRERAGHFGAALPQQGESQLQAVGPRPLNRTVQLLGEVGDSEPPPPRQRSGLQGPILPPAGAPMPGSQAWIGREEDRPVPARIG